MITNVDIIKLAKVLATKEDIQDLSEKASKVEDRLSLIMISIDGLAHKVDKIETETLVIKHKIGLI